jgi:hypothetical protein
LSYIYKGMAAGFAGALALAALLLINAETGFQPELDFVALVGHLTGTGMAGGWIMHFTFGALIGGLFAWLDPDLPGDSLRQRGIILASVVWLLAMFFLMPLGGAGFFGLNVGVLLPLAALALHIIFGAVMGGTYGWLLLQSVPLRYRQPREI